jgi:hypothetical protein
MRSSTAMRRDYPDAAAALALCLALVFCAGAAAQNITGTITGEVTDPSGANVVHASVAALHVATGVTYRAKANAAGVYVLALLPAGEYQLTADAAGFKTSVRTGLTLRAEERMRVDVALGSFVKVTLGLKSPSTPRVAVEFHIASFGGEPLARPS